MRTMKKIMLDQGPKKEQPAPLKKQGPVKNKPKSDEPKSGKKQ